MARALRPEQSSVILVHDVVRAVATPVFRSDVVLVEAPEWSRDGRELVVNADGRLYRLPIDASAAEASDASVASGVADERALVPVDLSGIPAELNNDHVLAPDGAQAYVTARDGHLYSVALDGSRAAARLTEPRDPALRFKHYLHGVSPDGSRLALIGGGLDASGRWVTNVFTMPSGGGPLHQLTDDAVPDDGVEFSPDGVWLYFNSERRGADPHPSGVAPGHAQIHRMRPDGGGIEQVVDGESVDWFPHPSPDGRWLLHLSYPPGTLGHPADLPVVLRLTDLVSRVTTDAVELFGGQGTTNVNGWAPDSSRFAYAAYPIATDPSAHRRTGDTA